jgi:aldoxime dehydratase
MSKKSSKLISAVIANTLLDDAIPAHLQVARTRPLHCEPDFFPKTVSICPRFKPEVTEFVMAIFGVQYKNKTECIDTLVDEILRNLDKSNGPNHYDASIFLDASGYFNHLIIAYWKSKVNFDEWQKKLAPDWWFNQVSADADVGTFFESFVINVRNTETTFSHANPAGYAHLSDAWSGPTDKHEYFGSARDRIAASQTDALVSEGQPSIIPMGNVGKLVAVVPYNNICLLRSGQDWQKTEGAEYEAYTQEIKPSLDAAMKDLEVNGVGIGCDFNRFAITVRIDGNLVNNTFSFSAWRSLELLENWTKKSPEHLEIFSRGILHYKKYPDAKLELWHELYVLPAQAQSYLYYGCHRKTGMMNACNVEPI